MEPPDGGARRLHLVWEKFSCKLFTIYLASFLKVLGTYFNFGLLYNFVIIGFFMREASQIYVGSEKDGWVVSCDRVSSSQAFSGHVPVPSLGERNVRCVCVSFRCDILEFCVRIMLVRINRSFFPRKAALVSLFFSD